MIIFACRLIFFPWYEQCPTYFRSGILLDHQSPAIKNGVIQDWEAMEELWRHGFHKLGVATEEEAWKVGQGQGQGRRQGQFSISEDLFIFYSRTITFLSGIFNPSCAMPPERPKSL